MTPNERARLRAVVAVGTLLAALLPLYADGGHEHGSIARLERWLAETRDLQASFEQRLVSGALGADLVERGELIIQRPGRMRWDYRDPEIKTVLIEGRRLEMYIAEDAQLVRADLPEDGDLLTLLLVGDRPLRDLFDVVSLPAESGAPRLRLRPRRANETVEEVVVDLHPRSAAIRSAHVRDAAGNEMEYRFRDLRRNRGIPASKFEFEPPSGTRIVDHDPQY